MMKKMIAWDLGTSGNKASLYDEEGNCLAVSFVGYPTYYSENGWHEQRPCDWWRAVVDSTNQLMHDSGARPSEICCCGISGHSLGVVPFDDSDMLLLEQVPIWSDARAKAQADAFFESFDRIKWYTMTGNGVNPAQYPVFKLIWYREHRPDLYQQMRRILGTKDYVNYRLTGRVATDHSYASGSGVFDIRKWDFSPELLKGAGLSRDMFPELISSMDVVGSITADAAAELGLQAGMLVVCGGVDNSMMAIGAKGHRSGRAYISLGSSCWVALTGDQPITDTCSYPYVFTLGHEMYNSALCIAAGGTTYGWIRGHVAMDMETIAKQGGCSVYNMMDEAAAKSLPGANRLIFVPCLGGGMPIDKSYNIRGGYLGLDFKHNQGDLIRAALEGISFNLGKCVDQLAGLAPIQDEILVVGGGSKSALWRQMLADCYDRTIVKTNIDEQAAALGAAACAAVGTGLWPDFNLIDTLHVVEDRCIPDPGKVKIYREVRRVYDQASDCMADIGDALAELNI